MTGIRRLRTELGFIYAPETINNAMGAMAADIAHAVAAGRWDSTDPEVSLRVLSGFELFNQDGLELSFTPGVLIGRGEGGTDDAGFQLAANWGGVVADLDAHDAEPRWDRVYLTVSAADIVSAMEGRVNAVPAAVNTQTGTTIVLGVAKGTADSPPVLPSLPAGAVLIADVYVPATTGAPTAIDRRPLAVGPIVRPADAPIAFVGDESDDTTIELLNVVGRTETADDMGTGPSWQSGLKWDRTLDYPVFTRSKSLGGDWTGDLCPMLIPNGREYWLTFPVIGANGRSNTSPSPVKLGVVEGPSYLELFETTDTGVDVMEIGVPLPWQIRNLEVVEAQVLYEVVNGFSKTSVTFAVQRMNWDGGTWNNILSKQIASMPVTGPLSTLNLTDVGDDPLGPWWRLLIYATKASGSGFGTSRLRVYGVRVKVREGREY